jgi:hypothetical protein
MKNNYKVGLLIACMFFMSCALGVFAQEKETFTIPLTRPNAEGKLVTHILAGSITVEGYDGNEVIVEAISNQKSKGRKTSKSSEVREGMQRVVDNSLEFTIEENNNTVYLKYSPGKGSIDFNVKVPRRFSVDLKTVNNGKILVEGVDGDHEVSNLNGPITMKNISGSVIADALNKDITIGFDRINATSNMMFTSLNGDLDIVFPKTLKANVMARSDNGNVYTDFEIVASKNSQNAIKTRSNGVYKVKREKGVSGTINGGGPDMTFKTMNGDILIRSNE